MRTTRLRELRFPFFLLLFAAAWCGGHLLAQAASGSIAGSVTDLTGAAVPGATVTISNPLSGLSRTATSDSAGAFHFVNLPFNHYHLSAEATGFAAVTGDADIRSAGEVPVTLKLNVASANTVVNVDAEAADMVSTETSSATTIDRVIMERLPVESAASGLGSIVTLSTPGIVSDSNGLYHPMGEHADTTYSIDGQPVSDQQSRTFGSQLSTNAIQSVNVIDGIAPPEYGDKASLIVEATTRSGLAQKPMGSVSFDYGTFGTTSGSASLGFGSAKFGNFVTVDGSQSGRYLDTPEYVVMHDKGNSEDVFDRLDFKPNSNDAYQLNLTASRSWFQEPNQFDQQASGQDQKAKIESFNVSPSWTHVFNTSGVLAVNPYVRRGSFDYYPSKNIFDDLPVTVAQNRTLVNAGLKADYSLQKGVNTLKFGAMVYHTFLNENFALGVTDGGFNAPCLLANGLPDETVAANNPAACPGGDTANGNYSAGLGAIDLTRGGKQFRFTGHADIKQEAIYAQDTIALKNLTLLVGGRIDNYVGISHRSLLEPRLGATYNVKRSNTVLRVGYGKLMLTPYNENLVLSGATGIGGLEAGGVPTPLKPATRTQYNAGFEQGITRHVIVNAEYFWKFTDRDFDFDTLLNSPLAFPIQWQKSKIDGFGVKINMPLWNGVSAYSVLGHTRSRFFSPEVGGILFNDNSITTDSEAFRIDHDQAFQQSTNVQYQPKKTAPWFGVTWRYESGAVAGAAPYATSTNGNDPVDLTYLTADQQQQAALQCGGVKATLANPLASCAGNQLSSPLLRLPTPGTENDDKNPPRVAPRTLFDLAAGWDDVLHRFRPSEKVKTNLSITAVNVTNKYALYNFLSTFSGTHFVSPRTVTGSVTFNF